MKVTGESCVGDDHFWPPGFRFHPTDEELVLYYLKRKICRRKLKLDIIAEMDVYKCDPEELPGLSILKTGDRQWFFFSPRDRKYPNGARSNRATRQGYWKATGKDRSITCNSRNVGVKKTLVFYRGRAPSGVRTDWVMHEYTLDEEEFKRCQNVKDYFALYKVFKKSGPGPKNGEQYGAPFKEEEWADDEDTNNPADLSTPVKQPNAVNHVDEVRANGQVESPFSDIEEFMRLIADDPAPPQQQADDFGYAQVVGTEDTQSTLLEPSSRDVHLPEPVRVPPTVNQQCDEQANFEFTEFTTFNLEPHEAAEVTSGPNQSEWIPQISEEGFLEMNDLDGPEPVSTVKKPEESFNFEELDGLSELDLFHDANMFIRDLGPIDQGMNSSIYLNDFEVDMMNQVDYQLQNQSNMNMVDNQLQCYSTVDQGYRQVQFQSMGSQVGNQFDYQQQNHPVGDDQINSQLWTYEQKSTAVAPQASNHGALSQQTSGSMSDVNQDKGGQEGGDSRSRFSSAMWHFVESIPTNPASASEAPLVGRAFERMSSFSRLRLNAGNPINVAAGNGSSSTVRRAGGSRGFFFISILGALCAIIWVLIGSVRILGRTLSS